MADLIIKVCDVHAGRNQGQEAGRKHTVAIDGVEFTLDACDPDWISASSELVGILEQFGTRLNKTGRPGTPQHCERCGQVLESKKALRKHMTDEHPEPPSTAEELPFPCLSPDCDHAPFKTNGGRAQHMRQKHGLDKDGVAA